MNVLLSITLFHFNLTEIKLDGVLPKKSIASTI